MYLDRYQKKLPDLCRKHKVESLYAFGSVLTDRFTPDSDVDLLVRFDKDAIEDSFLNFFDFKYSLEDLLEREVDLLEEQIIRNPVLRRSIDQNKQLLYGRAN